MQQRSFRWVTPGAAVGVLLWLVASFGFSTYVSRVADVGAIYGAFAGAIVLLPGSGSPTSRCPETRRHRDFTIRNRSVAR